MKEKQPEKYKKTLRAKMKRQSGKKQLRTWLDSVCYDVKNN